jgi:hypothetical protein
MKAAASVKCYPRLPTHLAHPLKDNRAVVIHALRPSLQGSRQNCSEPRCLLPADIPGCGLVVITTRRLCTINTRAHSTTLSRISKRSYRQSVRSRTNLSSGLWLRADHSGVRIIFGRVDLILLAGSTADGLSHLRSQVWWPNKQEP